MEVIGLQLTSGEMQRAKILFDLHGYYIVRNVFARTEIYSALNNLKSHASSFHERKAELRNSKGSVNPAVSGNFETGRFDFSHAQTPLLEHTFFNGVMNHKLLSSYLELFLGKGYRLDHTPLVISQKHGSEGFTLHGGPGRELWYSYLPKSQEVLTSLIGCSVALTDQSKEDGGFCLVKGSHKLNFNLTSEMLNLEDEDFVKTHLDTVDLQAGDVVLFSEATVHGCLAWTNKNTQRYNALYRFAPANCAFARGYLDTDKVNPVMEPPYSVFYDRKNAQDEIIQTRSETKKAFDKLVFKKEYF